MELSHCNRLIRYNRMLGCLNGPELETADWEKTVKKMKSMSKCYFQYCV